MEQGLGEERKQKSVYRMTGRGMIRKEREIKKCH
jgi:hypothetical protein